ncbi:MAG: methyltransferase domain-containing protein [Pseudomonadota bacterium]
MGLIRGIADTTSDHRVIKVGADYLRIRYPKAESRMSSVSAKADEIPDSEVYGIFESKAKYLEALKLLMMSTLDTEHKYEVFVRGILPRIAAANSAAETKDLNFFTDTIQNIISSAFTKLFYSKSEKIFFQNFLDIGIGSGSFTMELGKYFNNITVVDNSFDILNQLPEQLLDRPIHKILGHIEDTSLNIYGIKYDLILLSHVIYYLEKDELLPLLKRLYNQLTKNGAIVIAFNDEGDRKELQKHFGSKDDKCGFLQNEVPQNFDKVTLYRIDEFLDGGSIAAMKHIAGIALNDAGVIATNKELTEYLGSNFCPNDLCQLSMVQNIMVIGDINDY